MSDYLTIEDLNKVYLATFDARIKWRNILLMLEVSAATVETIGIEWSNNPDDCYREGLLEWLKGGDKSWEDLVAALSSPTVGHSDLARTVERDHVQILIQATPETASSYEEFPHNIIVCNQGLPMPSSPWNG